MDIGWLLTNLVAAFLLPPLNLLLLGGLGGWLYTRRRRAAGRALILLSAAALWLLSTPYVADRLLDALTPPRVILRGGEADAIVILGGGVYRDALEYGGDTVGRLTLERLRYGAWLARRLASPVLVTGGAPEGGTPEGQLMRVAMERDFGIPVRWVEDRSHNTRENAQHSAELLKSAGVGRIYLVTHAWHLGRALPEFERAGLVVVPAGIGYFPRTVPDVMELLPSAKGLHDSYFALHEGIGLIWYRMRDLF